MRGADFLGERADDGSFRTVDLAVLDDAIADRGRRPLWDTDDFDSDPYVFAAATPDNRFYLGGAV